MSVALVNGRVLREDGLVEGLCVLLEAGASPHRRAADDARCRSAPSATTCGGGLLLPGFIDSQVNGGGGVLFNDAPSVEAIRAIGARAPPLRHHRLPARP